MVAKIPFFFFLLVVCFVSPDFSSGAAPGRPSTGKNILTPKERSWLDAHPIILISPDPKFAPIEFIDKNGNFQGITADYMKLLEKILKIRFTIVWLKSWDEIFRRAQTKEIDMFGAAAKTPQRLRYMKFTKQYVSFPGVFVVRSDVEGSFDLEKIKKKRVATVSGYLWQELIDKDYHKFNFYLVRDVRTGLKQVSSGVVDVFIGNLATVSYQIEKGNFKNLRIAGETGYYANLSFAIRKDWPELLTIIEKGLARITIDERKNISQKWLTFERQPWLLRNSFWGGLIVFLAIAAFVSFDKYLYERKKSKEVLNRSNEMVARAEKLSSLGTLIAGAAHEILNPTNIIGLHAQRILRRSEKESREYVSAEVIYSSVKRISQICDDLRRFSRYEKSTFKFFNPAKTIQDSLNLLLHELRMSNIHYGLDIDDENIEISGDPNQIQQVLFNLIGNAKDAMPSGGNLRIAAMEVMESDRKWWECRISDTGHGIPEDILPRLFDPFFTTKPADKGTGLGLSVSYGIIENHGGRIWAESELGQGATFIVHLPMTSDG